MGSQSFVELCDQYLSQAVAASGVPGARFLALARDGSRIYSGQTGTLSQTNDQPITEETVFWIASATKVLTAMCAVKLVDQGLIGLDDDVLPHLPDLEKQQVRDAFMTPEYKLVPRKGNITLRHLLSFTAGVSYPATEGMAAQIHTIPTGSDPILMANKEMYIGPLNAQPGVKWEYSAAAEWAGALVERVSGLSLGEYLQRNILEPSGIAKGDITFSLDTDHYKRLASAHFRWPDGKVTPRGKIYSDDVQEHLGGMGAYAVADAFASALLPLVNDGKHPLTGTQILRPELVREMLRPQLNPEQQEWLNLPTLANNMQVLLPGVEKQWGLGFLLMPKGAPSGRGSGTASWAGFANTHWMVDPTNGIVMIVFAQLIPQEDPLLLAVRDKWETMIYDHLGSRKKFYGSDPPENALKSGHEPVSVSEGA